MAYNPINLGPTTMANSQAVSLPTDQVAIPVTIASLPALSAGSALIGSIGNTAFGISGTLPAFASTPTFNIGTIGTIATESTLSTLNTKIPSNLTVTSTRLLVDGSGVTQPVSLSASNSGGVTAATSGRFGTQGGSAAILINGSTCQVYGWYFYNPNSTVAYVHFYNASSITGIIVGTTTPYYVLPIPPVGGANVFGLGIVHGTGICIGVSQGRAVSTATTLDIDYNIFYKT
jgi:hypothetical protein